MTWTDAKKYCKKWNGRLIVLDSQEKWDYFTAHSKYQEYRLNETVQWIDMKFNDTFTCEWKDVSLITSGQTRSIEQTTTSEMEAAYVESTVSSPHFSKPETDVSSITSSTRSTPEKDVSTAASSTRSTPESDVSSAVSFTTSSTSPQTETDVLSTTLSTPSTSGTKEPATVSPTTTTTEAEIMTSFDSPTSTTPVISTTTALILSGVENDTCSRCCLLKNQTKLNQYELEEILHFLRLQLAVNKSTLSVQRRKLVNVYDSRPSSAAMGGVAYVILATVLGVIVVPDRIAFARFLYERSRPQRKNLAI
ncbi:cell wall protein DAN4-like [Pecten maximus]|uniref:cell wall protein DAN4-like n=1 Tax=Pecten maximus TaxID=6579 RepID=UPI0014588282|nr:cell wall protein DAN4-like [Pecten maximus]